MPTTEEKIVLSPSSFQSEFYIQTLVVSILPKLADTQKVLLCPLTSPASVALPFHRHAAPAPRKRHRSQARPHRPSSPASAAPLSSVAFVLCGLCRPPAVTRRPPPLRRCPAHPPPIRRDVLVFPAQEAEQELLHTRPPSPSSSGSPTTSPNPPINCGDLSPLFRKTVMANTVFSSSIHP
jgi:hypothetical protein